MVITEEDKIIRAEDRKTQVPEVPGASSGIIRYA